MLVRWKQGRIEDVRSRIRKQRLRGQLRIFVHVLLEAGEVVSGVYAAGGDRPLLKDQYANERKKAKMMNFSIAYGKTAHGFMKDWNCSEEEARATVNLWYADRPEVRAWQDEQH